MIDQTDTGNDDGTIRATLRFRWSLIIAITVQTVTLVGWLVQMHADIAYLKQRNEEQDRMLARIDENGSRHLVIIEERQKAVQRLLAETSVTAQKALDSILKHMEQSQRPQP